MSGWNGQETRRIGKWGGVCRHQSGVVAQTPLHRPEFGQRPPGVICSEKTDQDRTKKQLSSCSNIFTSLRVRRPSSLLPLYSPSRTTLTAGCQIFLLTCCARHCPRIPQLPRSLRTGILSFVNLNVRTKFTVFTLSAPRVFVTLLFMGFKFLRVFICSTQSWLFWTNSSLSVLENRNNSSPFAQIQNENEPSLEETTTYSCSSRAAGLRASQIGSRIVEGGSARRRFIGTLKNSNSQSVPVVPPFMKKAWLSIFRGMICSFRRRILTNKHLFFMERVRLSAKVIGFLEECILVIIFSTIEKCFTVKNWV